MPSLRLARSAILVFSLTACGIDVVGVDPIALGSGPEGGVPAEGGVTSGITSDGGVTPSPTSTTPTPPPPADSKWKPFAVAIGPAAVTCPGGASASDVLRTNPNAGAGACACQATSTVAPSCVNGTVTFKVGTGCGSTGVTTESSSATCHLVSGSLASSVSFTTLTPTGGSCAAQSASDPSKVTSDAVTLCPSSSSTPSGFRACVVTNGDVACDAAGFPEKHLAGKSTTLSCAGTCQTCKATATCTAASVDLYSDTGCGTKVFHLPADACTATGGASGSTVRAMIYNVTVTPKYEASDPLSATAGLDAPRTVCCAS